MSSRTSDIHTECEREPGNFEIDEGLSIVDVAEIGPVCDGYLYSICAECSAANTQFERPQREECADSRDHVGDQAMCQTSTGIERALDLEAFVVSLARHQS